MRVVQRDHLLVLTARARQQSAEPFLRTTPEGVRLPGAARGARQYEGAQSLVTTSETFAGYAAPSRRKIESGYSA